MRVRVGWLVCRAGDAPGSKLVDGTPRR